MKWADDQHGPSHGVDKAFSVLSTGPSASLTARQQKTSRYQAASWEEEEARKLTLMAYPALYPSEPDDFRLRRSDAFQRCWAALEQRMQEALLGTDAEVFASLLDLARRHHLPPPAAAALPRYGLHRMPTGLVLAGGVNSADHVRTFPNLAAHLRAAGCYVALLQPAAFARSVGEALNEVLRQLSGLQDTGADQFEALAAWYGDEVGRGLAQPPPASDAAADDADGDAEAPGGDSGSHGSRRRYRRARPPVAVDPSLASAEQAANRLRPVVVVVEGTEGIDPGCLADFISTLSEGYAALPATLVLGLTTTAAALHAALPAHIIDRALNCHHFNLATAIARLETLVRDVLLGPWPGLLLDYCLVDALWDRFLLHYFSPSVIAQGVRAAAMAHFRSNPASFLAAAAALEGEGGRAALKEACAELPAPVAARVKQAVRGAGGGACASVAEEVADAVEGWRNWALALHWTVAAAAAAGLTNGYTYWQLYRDALAPSFTASAHGRKLLTHLDRSLRRVGGPVAQALTAKLGVLLDRAGGEGACRAGAALRQAQQQREGEGAASGPPPVELAAADALRQRQQSGWQAEAGSAAANGAAAASSGGRKRDRFHSKSTRKEALLSKAIERGQQRNPAGSGAAAAAEAVESAGAKLASWLVPWLTEALRCSPTQLPGAKVFTCSDLSSLDCLSAAPREAIHTALTRPTLFLNPAAASNAAGTSAAAAAAAEPAELGLHPGMEDACLAFHLFDQDPACANVADWFTAFCDVHSAAAEPAPAGKRRGEARGKAPKRPRGSASGAGTSAAAAAAAQEEEAEAAQRRELAARFSQAAAELQFVGLIKPSKRRRGEHVQRLVHMPAAALGE